MVIMKSLLAVIAVLAFIHITSATSGIATLKPTLYTNTMILKCEKKENLTHDHIIQVRKEYSLNITEEKHRDTKCFQACLYEITKQMSSDGTPDLVAFKYQVPFMLSVVKNEKYEAAVTIATQCAKESSEANTDRCERAWLYYVCTQTKWENAGLFIRYNIKEIDENNTEAPKQ